MGSKQVFDWEAIERDYRAGLLSIREVAARHGCTHTAINKRAKADGWERDLQAKIKAKAEALVSKREVSSEVSSKAAETERQIVEANAEAIVSVRMAHRGDIRRSRSLANKLLAELEQLTDHREVAETFGEVMRKPDGFGNDRLNDLYHKIIALPNRTKIMRELADTLKVLIALERQAYNLDEQKHEEPYEERLRRLLGG
ncbi:hypothetical protein V0R48_18935 [Pseudomonas alcaligenes]|uniref:hypothetical protein n=1 Tax=Aquipseudomonas alcaligenes TaxID=43263 RepID=UPI002E7C34FC|nr:hypothetical protein [Pseudomonas alcaligenes]MEE1951058.1 hypothetical protein [Pseudomonas alcaligenes]